MVDVDFLISGLANHDNPSTCSSLSLGSFCSRKTTLWSRSAPCTPGSSGAKDCRQSTTKSGNWSTRNVRIPSRSLPYTNSGCGRRKRCPQKLRLWLHLELLDFSNCKKHCQAVVVHCRWGKNRSAALCVLLYGLWHGRWGKNRSAALAVFVWIWGFWGSSTSWINAGRERSCVTADSERIGPRHYISSPALALLERSSHFVCIWFRSLVIAWTISVLSPSSHHSLNVAEWQSFEIHRCHFRPIFCLGWSDYPWGNPLTSQIFRERSGFQHGMLPTCISSNRNGGIKPAILVISSEWMYCKRERSNLWPSVVVLPENFPNAAIWGSQRICVWVHVGSRYNVVLLSYSKDTHAGVSLKTWCSHVQPKFHWPNKCLLFWF